MTNARSLTVRLTTNNIHFLINKKVVTNMWETVNTFKIRLDKFWLDQEVLYDYKIGDEFTLEVPIGITVYCILGMLKPFIFRNR